MSYQLLWQDEAHPEVVCVMLRCCAGPELQLRRGSSVLLSELLKTAQAVLARAEELRGTAIREAAEAVPGAGTSA